MEITPELQQLLTTLLTAVLTAAVPIVMLWLNQMKKAAEKKLAADYNATVSQELYATIDLGVRAAEQVLTDYEGKDKRAKVLEFVERYCQVHGIEYDPELAGILLEGAVHGVKQGLDWHAQQASG